MHEKEKWDLRAAGAARAGLGADAVDLALLPAYSGKTIACRESRRDLLRDYLREQLAEVCGPAAVEETPPPAADPSAPPQPLNLERVCATCRGHCCRKGGEHGYVSPSTLQRVLAADPTVSGDALIDTYLSHVPTRSYAGSCIYHAASGCALPRALRSETCTRYMCDGLKAVSTAASESPERAVIGLFERVDGSLRMMMVQNGEVRELRPRRWSESK
jgi:hypothetical protein